MSRVTFRGKALLGSAVIAMAVAMTPAPPARASLDTDALLAIIAGVQTWIQTVWKVYEKAQLEIARVMRQKMFQEERNGNRAITKQVAANTTGLQSALQQHAAVVVETEKRVLQKQMEDKNRRTFGSLGSFTFDGKRIGIDSSAPTACMRYNDAPVLEAAGARAAGERKEVAKVTSRQNQGYGTLSAATDAMAATYKREGQSPDVFGLDWISKTSLTPDEVRRARSGVAFATNPTPLVPTPRPHTAAGREYTMRATALTEMMKLPQDVLGRQLSLRASGAKDSDKSALAVIDHWAHEAVDDRLGPVALQGKTLKGVQTEMALTLHALLYIENERMKSDQERNAMLALMLSKRLQEAQRELRQDYNKSFRGD